jgi:hypothetical protein
MGKKFIVKDKTNGSYYDGNASFHTNLYDAKIFDEKDLSNHNYHGNEIIFLDTVKGLELLTEEIKSLDSQVPEAERRLNEMKKGREKLCNSNFKMVSKFVERYNKQNHHLIGISPDTEKRIIENIVKEK